ncbi:MAG: hypothetical protein ABEK50_00175 [bacterium]
MMFRYKSFLAVSIMLVFAVVMSGCGGGSDQTRQVAQKSSQQQEHKSSMETEGDHGEEGHHEQSGQPAGGGRPEKGGEEKAGHSHGEAQAHGGNVTMTTNHHFEVVYKDSTIQVWGYDKQQEPISLEGVQANVHIKTRSGKSERINLELHPSDEGLKYLEGHYTGLSGIEPGNAKLTFHLAGVKGTEEAVEFTQTYEPSSGGHGEEGHHEESGQHGEEGHHNE